MNQTDKYKLENAKQSEDQKPEASLKIVPRLVPVDTKYLEEKIFQGVDDEFRQPLTKVHKYIFSKLQTFDPEELKSFEFQLPDTFIPKKGVLAIYQIEKKHFDKEDLSARNLTTGQVKEVFNKGCFTVKSKKYNQDYIWQVSTFLVKGTERILETFYKDLSWAYYHIHQIRKRISDYRNKSSLSLAQGLTSIKQFFPNLYFLFFGYRMFNNEHKEEQQKLAIQRERMKSLLMDSNVDATWHKYIAENPEKIKTIRHFQKNFMKMWSKKKFELVKGMQADEFQLINLLKEQYEYFYKELEKDENFAIFGHEKKVRSSFLSYFKSAVIINKEDYYVSLDVDKYYSKQLEDARIKFIIKSKVKGYVEEQLERNTIKYRERQIKKRDANILEKLKEYPAQKYLFQNYLNYINNFNKNLKGFKLQNYQISGLHKYYINKYYTYPGISIQDPSTGLYFIEDHKILSQGTDKCCWRVSLMILRYVGWTNNAFHYLKFSSYYGFFGFNRLSLRNFYYPHKKIDRKTGEILIMIEKPEHTILGKLKEICEVISQKRKAFESKPNRGFFPKGCGRLYNYLETYFYLGLIQGICIRLVLHLAGTLIFAPTFFLLCYASPVWMIFIVTLHRFIQILIVDDDNHGDFPTARFFPLFVEFFKLFILGFCQIIFSIFGLVLHPVFAVVIFLFAIVRMIIRKVYDILMIGIIYCLGRVPRSNSTMAWLTSGPGIYKSNYISIETEDLVYLFINHIEILEVENFLGTVEKAINYPEKAIRPFLDRLGEQLKMDIYKNEPKDLISSTKVLTERMRNAVQKRRNQLHEKKIPNVRFTEQELLSRLTILEGHLKDLYSRKDLYFIWDRLEVDEMDFLTLTKKILSDAFDPGILYPLEEISSRTKLVANREREFDQFFEILEGKTGNTFENLKAVEGRRQEGLPLKGNFLPTPGFLSVDYVTRLTHYIYDRNIELSLALDPSVSEPKDNNRWADKEFIIPIK